MNPLSLVFKAFVGITHGYMWKNISTDYLGHIKGDRLFFGEKNKAPEDNTFDR